MRLERIWAQQEKDRLVAEALAKFAAMQTVLLKCGDKAARGEITQTEPKKEEANMKAGRGTTEEDEKSSKTERKKTHAKMAVKRGTLKSSRMG